MQSLIKLTTTLVHAITQVITTTVIFDAPYLVSSRTHALNNRFWNLQ